MHNFTRRLIHAVGLAASAAAVIPAGSKAQPAAIGSDEQRLHDLGIILPKFTPVPGINNLPFIRTGNLVFLSGLGPRLPDGGYATGKVPHDVSVDEATQRARNTGLRLLSVLREAAGSLDNVVRVVKVFGMVNAAPDFTDHPKVINGCSDLFVAVFGDRGKHARTAVGMASLPFDLTVEIEAIFEVL
jgi:enamine deaminase RidA (YjgF/YER057c/UK114 family)